MTLDIGVQGSKWALKSVGGLLANLALLTVWVDVVGLHPAVAIVPNFVIISIAGYAITDQWIFPDGVSPQSVSEHVRQYVGMQSANIVGKAGNYGIYLIALPVIDYRAAWVLGAGVTFALSFTLNRWWWTRPSAIAQRR